MKDTWHYFGLALAIAVALIPFVQEFFTPLKDFFAGMYFICGGSFIAVIVIALRSWQVNREEKK